MVAKKAFNGLRLAVSYPMHNDDPRRLFPHKTPAEIGEMGNAIHTLLSPQDVEILTNRYRRKLGV